MDHNGSTTASHGDVSPAGTARDQDLTAPDVEIASIASEDVAEHADLLQPWDVRIDQLSPGPFRGTLDALRTPSTLLYEESWSRSAQVRGATPPGYVLLGLHLAWRRSPLTWCRTELGPRRLACAGPASEMHLSAPDPSHHVVALVKPEFLAQGLGWEAVNRLSSGYGFGVSRDAGLHFGGHVTGVLRRYLERPEALSRPLQVRSIESDLLDVLIRCFRSLPAVPAPAGRTRRSLAVQTAVEFAHSCRGRATAHELSIAAGVSQRTLEYAFREQLGMTPGVFLRMTRLNQAHRELLESDPRNSTVGRIAANWGFHQHGRFSRIYRQHFGEPPSRTLLRYRPSWSPTLSELSPVRIG